MTLATGHVPVHLWTHEMCNLYNVTTTQQAIIEWSRAMRDVLGNLEPTIDIYPNYLAPSCATPRTVLENSRGSNGECRHRPTV